MNNNSHTWFIFSLFVRLEWGGVYFDNGDLISPSPIHKDKQLETIFKEPFQFLSLFKDRRQSIFALGINVLQ